MNRELLTAVGTLFLLAAIVSTVAAAPETQSAAEAMRYGEQAFLQRDFSKAKNYFRAAYRQKPFPPDALVRMGLSDWARHQYEEAFLQWSEAQKLRTSPMTARFLREALSFLSKNRPLFSRIQKARISGGNTTELLELHAEAFRQAVLTTPFISLAAPHADYLLEGLGERKDLLRYLADSYYESSDHAHAVRYYRRLSALGIRDMKLWMRLADSLVNVGNYGDARFYYKKSLRLSFLSRDKGIRKKLLKKIRLLQRESAYLYALLEREEYQKLYPMLKRILSLNPGDPTGLVLMGAVYEGIGWEWMAQRLYERVVSLYPEMPAGHSHLGRFYLYKKKRFEGAAREFELFQSTLDQYYPADPTPGLIKKLEEERASMAESVAYLYAVILKNPSRAATELERLLEKRPGDEKSWYNLGCLYLDLQKKMSAYQAFKKVIDLKPGSELARLSQDAIEILRKKSKTGYGHSGPYD